MNIIYCFYLVLLVHCIDAAFLRSFPHLSSKWSLDRQRASIIESENEVTTSEPVLSRRRPQLISPERRRRWSTNDEVEIPVEQSSSTSSTVADLKQPLLRQDTMEMNQIDEVTTVSINEEVSETNHTQIKSVNENEIIDTNSTGSEILNETNQTISDSFTTIETTDVDLSTTNRVTEQDTAIILFDFTTFAPITLEVDETSTDSHSEVTSSYDLTTIADEVLNTTIALDTVENNATSIPEEVDITTQTYSETDISTIMPEASENITEITTQVIDVTTVDLDVVQNSTDTIEQQVDNTTAVFDVVQNNTDIIEQEIDNTTAISVAVQNDTEITTTQQLDLTTVISDITESGTTGVVYEDNEYSNETINEEPSTTPQPICDQSCQCFRKCPYGFEIVNDTCQCDPPCKNYQCFGNDTCIVSMKGQPECRPTNESDHDRPFRCYQPRVAGYHDENIRYYDRWYYNADQDVCHLFVYRGLGGNTNNFVSLHECNLECIICAPKPNPGLCLGHMRKWYYNHTTNQCSQFEYSGCKGNENNFIRKQDCLDTCVTRILNF